MEAPPVGLPHPTHPLVPPGFGLPPPGRPRQQDRTQFSLARIPSALQPPAPQQQPDHGLEIDFGDESESEGPAAAAAGGGGGGGGGGGSDQSSAYELQVGAVVAGCHPA